VQSYYRSALDRGRRLVYFRFANHERLLPEQPGVEVHELRPREGFEAFVGDIHRVIQESGRGAWYLFDCLSDLADAWYSDNMLGNWFVLTCPYLYDVEAIAYFSLIRHAHASEVLTLIRETAQVFLDVYHNKGHRYVHPIKVQQRHSPTMYMLHVWEEDDFLPVLESATTAEILSNSPCLPMESRRRRQGIWYGAFFQAGEMLAALRRGEAREQETEKAFARMLRMAISRDEHMLGMVNEYFTMEDILALGRRIIGTGLIGGKSIGMLLARAILSRVDPKWADLLEPHDSFYIGSDVFYTYLVQNGLWWEWQKHHNQDDFLAGAERARQRILVGKFPEHILAEFQVMLDYFGQSPIIVRSSSLLEDNFEHSFAGKYESVFLPNQGSREQRQKDFMSAVRTIYASTMSERALTYRAQRGMLKHDEQMALLVQRVSGAVHGSLFYPHLAGVGFSYNPYVWSDDIEPEAGMLRLVFGLGTRAVDRSDDDFARLVSLNAPEKLPVASVDEFFRYAQRRVDVLDYQANHLVTRDFDDVGRSDATVPIDMFATRYEPSDQYGTRQRREDFWPWVLTFEPLIKDTDYIPKMRRMLRQLQDAYGCPVDVEFTTNFLRDDNYKINLVQCRPLLVRVSGAVAEPPESIDPGDIVLEARGAIVGQGRLCEIDRIIYVAPSVYGELNLSERYSVARLIGKLMHLEGDRKAETIMLIGPGRWGTTTPWLGVPVAFGEINTVSVLCEIVAMRENLVPDVSLGTHFFSELVEGDILYFALFPEKEGNSLNADILEQSPNRLVELMPEAEKLAKVVLVIDDVGANRKRPFVLNANTLNQRAVCYLGPEE